MPPFYKAMPHLVEIVNQGFDESKERRTPFFFLEFKPIAERVGDQFNSIDGKFTRTIKLYITEKTLPHFRRRLASLGWEGASFRELEPTTANAHLFEGTETVLECTHVAGYEEWEFPYDGPPAKPKESDASIGRKLDALFGKSSGGARKPNSRTKPAQKDEPPTDAAGESQADAKKKPAADEDIPF